MIIMTSKGTFVQMEGFNEAGGEEYRDTEDATDAIENRDLKEGLGESEHGAVNHIGRNTERNTDGIEEDGEATENVEFKQLGEYNIIESDRTLDEDEDTS